MNTEVGVHVFPEYNGDADVHMLDANYIVGVQNSIYRAGSGAGAEFKGLKSTCRC